MDEYLAGILDRERPVAVKAPEPFAFVRLFGAPRGKGRPRTRVVGQFATIYTDAETRKYENALKAEGIKVMAGRDPADQALAVVIYAYMPVPASWSASKKAAAIAGDIMPTTGIDLDNIEKMLDGLNYHPPRFKGDREKRPIIWCNDSQIVSMQAMKCYSDVPRLEITVWLW
jgi:Holliday junction resolvase RusA-like endonuclease